MQKLDVDVSTLSENIYGLTLLRELMENDDRSLKDPAPQTMIMCLGASSVDIHMRCWCNSGDYSEFLFHLNKAAKETPDKAGLSIPYPQQDVHLHQVSVTSGD